ncbi:MAG: hypothetical protein EBW15_07795, partial [Actinobacteria bacterium]|nr:hypothetical protein [Actinomycetota bacterium]
IINDQYPHLSGMFFITSKGTISLINHDRNFESAGFDFWKNYLPQKQQLSFHIERFHFLVEESDSFLIALPFFEKHFASKLRPIYSETNFYGKQEELGYLWRFGVISLDELQSKRSLLRQDGTM